MDSRSNPLYEHSVQLWVRQRALIGVHSLHIDLVAPSRHKVNCEDVIVSSTVDVSRDRLTGLHTAGGRVGIGKVLPRRLGDALAGVLGGLAGQAARRFRRRHGRVGSDPNVLGRLAHPAGVDGQHPVHVDPARLHRTVSVGGLRAAGVLRQRAEFTPARPQPNAAAVSGSR